MKIEKIGIGTDIEHIDRFRDFSNNRTDSFLNKVFTKKELEYCFSKESVAPHLATRFTGKEAIIKALNGLGRSKINPKDIEILNNEAGVPIANLSLQPSNLQIKLSLSHSEDKAIAFAIIIEGDNNG